jgi:pilus assembly protein Flp/PilA
MQDLFLRVYAKMQTLAYALKVDESGQDLIEYALVVALIALAATAGMGQVATAICTAFSKIGSHLNVYAT